jgi:NarL family two-component system response regulator LiaR
VIAALKAGARGYILKDSAPDELIQAIEAVYAGQLLLPSDLAQKALFAEAEQAPPSVALTERETEVLRCLARGMTNQEIAATLSISLYTVRSHVRNILGKLHLANRTQAALYARDKGLIENQ